jgi:phosphate transport system protein
MLKVIVPEEKDRFRMSRTVYRQELQEVKDNVLLLGSMVETAMRETVRALKDNDLERSRLILKNDLPINWKRYRIETDIMVLMATQQPVAGDLRMLAASLAVCNELERIDDYAKAIAKVNLRSQGLSMPSLMIPVQVMAKQAVEMLQHAMTTYGNEDTLEAESVLSEDDIIDAAYAELYTSVMQNVIDDPRNIERTNYVSWVAHTLQRLGDRATKICKRVIFMVSGDRYPESLSTETFPE